MKEYISSRIFPPEYLKNILKCLSNWTNIIENNNNFSFVKFGDGELLSIAGKERGDKLTHNCDKHSFDKGNLPEKLKESWIFLNNYNKIHNNVYIAKWTSEPFKKDDENSVVYKTLKELESIENFNINYVNYEILLQNTLSQEKFDFFESIKKTNRKKIFVGPEILHNGVGKWLNTINIAVPLVDVIDEYDKILENIYNEIENNCIIMFSCSIPAKSFIHKSLEKNPKLTCLDIGSGFDPMFFKITREGQFDKSTILKYYNI
jgi:hypothetical protein